MDRAASRMMSYNTIDGLVLFILEQEVTVTFICQSSNYLQLRLPVVIMSTLLTE